MSSMAPRLPRLPVSNFGKSDREDEHVPVYTTATSSVIRWRDYYDQHRPKDGREQGEEGVEAERWALIRRLSTVVRYQHDHHTCDKTNGGDDSKYFPRPGTEDSI